MNYRRRSQTGLSLIEVMVVIIIILVASTSITMGIGALTKSKLKASCMRVISASHFAYHRSITQGKTMRIVLDLDDNTISVEQGRAGITISRSEQEEGDEEAIDPWASARARLENPLAPVIHSSAFEPITNENGQVIQRYKPHEIGDGIQILRIMVPHDPNPISSGKASIYFFPNGHSEHAIVQLSDLNDHVMTVELLALTGRGFVHAGAYEPEEIDDPASDLRDPG